MRSLTEHEIHVVNIIENDGVDLLAYLTRRVAEPADAADLLGGVFAVLWRRRSAVPAPADEARMWAFGVARNLLRDYRKKGVRQEELSRELRQHIEMYLRSQIEDPLEAELRRQLRADVRAAIGELKPDDQELVRLVHWDAFSISEAATLLGLKPSTARTRYARARAQLASVLEVHRRDG